MSVASRLRLLRKLKNKKYRDAYFEEHVKTSVPFQIRTLREQREWSQGKLASKTQTTQTAISRLENPDYGKLSLNSLYKLASAFDVAVLIKFVPFSRLVKEFEDASPQALSAKSFEDELEKLEEWAAAEEEFAPQAVQAADRETTTSPARNLRGLPTNTRPTAIDFRFMRPFKVIKGEATRQHSLGATNINAMVSPGGQTNAEVRAGGKYNARRR